MMIMLNAAVLKPFHGNGKSISDNELYKWPPLNDIDQNQANTNFWFYL